MVEIADRSVASFLTDLQASGRVVFSGEEAQRAIGSGRGAFLDAAERLQRRGQLLRPRQDFYVVVPPQYRNLGSPPLSWFIDDLMRREGSTYYVGLLKAAELHGAGHQAAMEFQIVTDKRMPAIRTGRSKIAFYYRKDMTEVVAGIEERKTESGAMKISSAALTILDLLRYPQASGGIDNVLTILNDLGRTLDGDKLAGLAKGFERSVVQRAGYLLSLAGLAPQAEALERALRRHPQLQWVELDPSLASQNPDLAAPIIIRDERWRVAIRHVPEPDE